MTYRIQFKKTLLGVAAALLLLPCNTVAQSTLSQNQDGFNGETMDGFMNTDPDKDSTVVERTVSHDYSQFVINTKTGLPEDIQPDTLHHSDWPSVIYGPERPFSQTAVFAFSTL